MNREKLLQICIDKREGKINKSWDELNSENNQPFANGEALRGWVKKELKKINKLPSKVEKVVEQEIQSKQEIEKQKKELNQIKKEYEQIEKEIGKLESQEERRLKVIENGEYYTICSKIRQIKVSKEKVRLIKQLYCDDNGLNISELCRKVDIPRRDFMLIKYAFNIVHDDVPYLDEELENENLESLVDTTLERKKEQYFNKLREKEIELMKRELKQYREKDYLYDKIVEGINEIVINPIKYNVEIKPHRGNREALLDIEDLHLGLSIRNYWNTYNSQVARERMKQLTMEVIETCAELGVNILHVSDLGDNLAGIIHDTIIKESELDVKEQVKFAVELIGKMLVEFSLVFDEVVYSDTVGNHGRMIKGKDECSEKENFEYFISWGLKLMLQNYANIKFEDNNIDDGIIVKNIAGVKIYEVHGHLDKFNKVASDLTMMIGKSDEVHLGHLHHNKSEDFHDVEVFIGRSFSGTDTYAKNGRMTGIAGQRLFIYENGRRVYIRDINF